MAAGKWAAADDRDSMSLLAHMGQPFWLATAPAALERPGSPTAGVKNPGPSQRTRDRQGAGHGPSGRGCLWPLRRRQAAPAGARVRDGHRSRTPPTGRRSLTGTSIGMGGMQQHWLLPAGVSLLCGSASSVPTAKLRRRPVGYEPRAWEERGAVHACHAEHPGGV